MNSKSIDIRTKLNNYKVETKNLEKALREYVKDESVPLLERWQWFVDSDMGNIDTTVTDLKAIRDRHTLMENLDKYGTYIYSEFVEDYFEYNDEGDLTSIDPDETEFVTAVITHAMKNFEKGFIHNW